MKQGDRTEIFASGNYIDCEVAMVVTVAKWVIVGCRQRYWLSGHGARVKEASEHKEVRLSDSELEYQLRL